MEKEGENLKKKLKGAGIEINSVADKLKMTRQNLGHHLRREPLNAIFREKLLSAYPNVFTNEKRSDNILHVENKPQNQESNVKNPRIEAEPLYLASDPNDYNNDGSKFEHREDGIIRMRIKVIAGQKARGGYLRGFQDPEFYEDLRTISIDVEKEFRGHYMAFEIVGDSMMTTEESLLHMLALPGWLAIARELPHHHWKNKLHINKVKHWVIVHETDGILIKNIVDHDVEKGLITIHSINPKYEDEILKLSDIAQLFAVHHFMVKP
ncbi:hypothetical protein [Mucilaginibacter xinganensis]|uniref:Peptidase S24/S26A/S26B/S26C domain-containing protein n=1 Tax=Mucilaginibacter xinganensis TaxID=1234841 RepID=A0A223NWU9_9SPHI|nr:hypothetical protein [Mucilaginibacter xinganensis]ASU34353.1 hypothetical protein MuYL_2466 [Mucilaginibacter xinganensis]